MGTFLTKIDTTTTVMVILSFHAAPCKGHLDQVECFYGCLCKMKRYVVRVWTEEPDYSDSPTKDYDLVYYTYGNVREMKPSDTPDQLD